MPDGPRRRARPGERRGPGELAARPRERRLRRVRARAGAQRRARPRVRAQCLVEEVQSPYDALLGDYDFGLRSDELQRVFGALAARCRRSSGRARALAAATLAVPVERPASRGRRRAARGSASTASWRVDVSAHPVHRLDRAARHPPDHALQRRRGRVAAELAARVRPRALRAPDRSRAERTNLGHGTSMSVHESQSKLWENHVARNPAFAEVLAAELAAGGFGVSAAELHAALVGSSPRRSASPPTRSPTRCTSSCASSSSSR